LGYGAAGLFEPKLAALLPPEQAEACLVLPGSLTLFDHAYNKVCRLSVREDSEKGRAAGSEKEEFVDLALKPAKVGEISSNMEKAAYLGMVAEIQERIRQGEAIQVVPSVRFEASFSGEPFTIYRRLRRINPSPYMFFMRLPGLALMGSSPEVMVGCDAGVLSLCPIAGTRPRGSGEEEDNLFEEALVRDQKEQAEHVMLVDLGRNDLGRVAEPGTVQLDRYMEVERFSHVMHLTSYIRAKLARGRDALDILQAVFPAGTVSGAPKIRAMEIIAGYEPAPRGPYAGAIGWLGLDKDSVHMDTGITIRSLWAREGKIFWQAGGGVVFDSVPEEEWKEINNKAAAVRAAISAS
jgi:anthranilate synthase component 1